MKAHKIYFYVLFHFIMVFKIIIAQEIELTTEIKKKMISDINTLLIENYVFENIAKNCAQKLDSVFKTGEYDSIFNKEEFAKRLTQHLQVWSKDKHLEVQVKEILLNSNSSETVLESINRLRESRQKSNYSFKKIEILDGNIGYLDFRAFSPAEMAMVKASAAIKFLSDCDALIIDMRKNTGGNPSLIAYICSYFFKKPTLLNRLYYRKTNRTLEFWTREVDDVKTLYEVPMFVLTSKETFSASEEFAYDLQTRKRATIIGEITGGGANIAGGFRLNNSFVIYIPRGRAINPVTNENWEGVGIQPDVYVTSEKALEKALEIANVEAKKCRNKKEENYKLIIHNLENHIERTNKIFESGYDKDVEDKLVNLLKEAKSINLMDESSLTALGYNYLHKERYLLSLTVFKFCVAIYPESYNAYDSLGEAYMKSGNKELAIKNYQKSLDLNPNNENAIRMLRDMQEDR